MNHNTMVSSYLSKIANSAADIGEITDQTTAAVASAQESPDALLDKIAHNLLASSKPSVLALGAGHLPSLDDANNKPKELEEEGTDSRIVYQYRRTDYLRQLLRAMAPIALDVSARICSTVLSTSSTASDESTTLSAIILFSHWLPVAPHLSSMVMDFFQAIDYSPWKNNHSTRGNDDDECSSRTLCEEFVIVEAIYQLCLFYQKRNDIQVLKNAWDWSFVYQLTSQRDEEMADADPTSKDDNTIPPFHATGIRWFAARILPMLMNWKPAVTSAFLQRLEIQKSRPFWIIHPWMIDEEEEVVQHLALDSKTKVWRSAEPIPLPSVEQIRASASLHPQLVMVGTTTIFYKQLSILEDKEDMIVESSTPEAIHNERLISTSTTSKNLSLLGAALCQQPYPPPILVCGPHGSGKSSLVRELVNLCSPLKSLLEIHVDEETDSKTLIGSYTATDIPGEFAWRPGALTCATKEGRWVLLEDLDSIPEEIQASLVKLFEERLLPLGNGKYEKCHPNFRIFGTCTTTSAVNAGQTPHDGCLRIGSHRGSGKKILNPSLWRKVHVEPLPFEELKEIAQSLYQNIPEHVIDTVLQLQRHLDSSGRTHLTYRQETNETDQSMDEEGDVSDTVARSIWTGRSPSVRDFFKVLSRIQNSVSYEKNTSFSTEAQRTLCLAECVDIFAGSCPDRRQRRDFISSIAAPVWKISTDLALSYSETRRPEVLVGQDYTTIGRANIGVTDHHTLKREVSENFAQTSHSLRLLESIGVCVRENEPILLVGETGGGKTTLVQQLAGYCERELIVQNLSLQTDSTDLLGGFRPLELHHVARQVYREFVDLFVSTFSRKQNAQFLEFASTAHEKKQWKKLSQCFSRAAQLGLSKVKERTKGTESSDSRKWKSSLVSWRRFEEMAKKFEKQRVACDAGMAFVFTEGALIDAIRYGKWVLLDEINLAASDTLQRLCGLLDDPRGSVVLTERGDSVAIERHPNFRLFAAMNPATDAGKKDLPASIRSRFSELYVDELLDPIELRLVSVRYIESVLPKDGRDPEHSDIIVTSVDVYLKCRELAESSLVDGGGHKPRFTLRSLSRALSAAKNMVLAQRLPLRRAIYEGFQLSFEGALESQSTKLVRKVLKSLLDSDLKKNEMDHPGRKPGGKSDSSDYVLIKPFWVKTGSLEPVDWSEAAANGRSRFILTPSTASNLRKLARTLAAGPWPVLLEGPTSAGKTTLVEYIAARAGHHVVRINNHEHTDVQEYTGSFSADQNGTLSFRDGILVRALKLGHWVILDELNLAPSEVLEALNRLLDDNRELYIAETNETVKPHPDFRLFATQNPCGAYGGRKPLSRAFRNRFVEIHVGDIPSQEMVTILEKRCGSPPSHAKKLVDVMITLRQRRSRSGVFLGKDSFITPRDLLRWAGRQANSTQELAQEGFMLLAERLRTDEEKNIVTNVIEEQFKIKLSMEELYFGPESEARKLLASLMKERGANEKFLLSMAPTNSFLRLICLVLRCIRQKEPVLLVGETGCGKTTVIQFLSMIFKQDLHALNCHATTETSDLIGGLRPVRGRDSIAYDILRKVKELYRIWPFQDMLETVELPGTVAELINEGAANNDVHSRGIGADSVATLVKFSKSIINAKPHQEEQFSQEREAKRLKKSPECEDKFTAMDSLISLYKEIESLGKSYTALFEWSDGPLVKAMKSGDMMLLDEMSLAEDAVLERLNSVLEPSRTLVLAEKGDDGNVEEEESRVILAHESFRIFATMNPGGDFGKRELSPALRSRFTEIWVPAITERRDFDLVLSRCFESISDDNAAVRKRMLDYVFWFNETIAGDSQGPCSGLTLTLRDILSWAKFIIHSQCAENPMGKWDAFCHGACLMHLDGLGLGAGLSLQDAAEAQAKAEDYLKQSVPTDESLSYFHQKVDIAGDGDARRLGCEPFFISYGPFDVEDASFDMSSPTTSLNMYRVLRAMYLERPIILEGPPGVGKTSLITALAKASGHKLVRINLSEQTDITDLMGSDLPVQDSESSEASFKWCDGVLLTAIKEGSWVLLDELNLASQSVLEGLNSCLDHRASVYIPELGKTFDCPKTFRVFAAQNPLGQGGGRKGLPKSFLNRFTKVYVNSLTEMDFQSIVASRFPSLDSNNVNRMITFNQRVHMEVEETRSFGHSGSPWEFNLRDVFRWCDLLIASGKYDHSHVRDLYLQRFRSQEDRLKLDAIYREVFGSSALSLAAPIIRVEENFLRVGDTRLQRRVIDNASKSSSMQMEPDILFGYRNPTEAVARCVSLGWPCLLVGPSRSGKSSIIKVLAELCNETVVEQCLSPSSDVTELIGCFEQLDSNANERSIVEDLRMICEEVLFFKSSPDEKLDRVWRLFSKLYSEEKKFIGDEKSSLFLVTKELSDLLLDLVSNDKVLESRCGSLVRTIAARLNCQEKGQEEGKSSHFVWKDGVLVEAMKYGHWLHLENVNLCPASVLDRLNSVMERGGFLLLSECGNQNGEASGYQIIRPHPNFRVFLTMNPMYGEISRAMRNRCVEIAMLPPVQNLDRDAAHSASTSSILDIFNQDAILDSLSVSRRGGLRSFHLVTFLIDSFVNEKRVSEMHGAESPCISTISALATLTTDLLARGIPGTTSILTAVQLSMEVTADQACRYRDNDSYKTLTTNHSSIGLPHDISLRAGWASDGGEADIGWRSRILRPYMNGNTLLLSRVLSKKDGLGISHIDSPPYPELIDSGSGGPFDQSLLDQLLSIFMGNSLMVHCDVVDFFEGMANACSRIISEMVTKLKAMNMIRCSGVIRPQSTGESSASFANDDSNYLQRLITRELIDHIVHRLREEEWIAVVSREEFTDMTTCTMSVLQLSWYIEDGRLDRASITCPVTPTLYPLFKTFDKWVDQTVTNPSSLMTIVDDEMLHSAFHNLLQHRSSMWDTLEACDFSSTNSGFLGFDESEFLVLWRWFNKSLERMITRIDMVAEHLSEGLASLRSMADGINYSVYGGSFQTNAAAVFRKYMNKPLVPQKKEQWIMLNQLKGLSKELSVLDGRFQPLLSQGDALSLPELVDLRHPALFIPPEYRFDLLAALCTAYWSVVDEMGASHRTLEGLALSRNAIKSLQAMFSQQKEAFFASFAAIKVDTRIETVENQLDVAKLEQFRQSIDEFTSESTMYKDISSVLLGTFGRLQLSSIVEFWSLHEEKWLIDNIRQILLFKRNEEDVKQGVLLLVPRLQKFVKIVVSKSLRNVVDMRPYQTLLWAMEQNGNAKEESVITLLRHLLPSMANTYSQGIWTNSFTNLRLVDSKMEMPTLWLDDASVKPSAGFEQLELNVDNCGPIRLEHQVRSELAFRLVGEHFSWYGGLRRTDLCTMENFTSRKAQMADMLDLFSTLDISESHDEPIDVQYFVFEILQSAQECFPDQAFEEILRLVRMPELFAETPIDDMRKFLHLTSNAILKASIDDLMIPLFSSLQSLWNNKSPSNRREQYAMTLIYIGLLRLLVLSPESPQDPGRTPLAKVCLINQRLELVRKKIAAIQLDRWFVHGDLTLECDDAQQVLRHGNHMISKRSSQEKKVIERSDDAPQFYDLFQEVRDFVRGVGRKEQVLGLCRAIRQCHNGGDSFEKVKQREFNWQSTSGAFCTLLDRSYGPYYEEITSNLTESVRSIQNGLRMLLQTKVQPTSVSMVSTAFQQLMRYPVEPSIRQTSQLVSAIVEMTVSRHENSDSALAQTRCQQAAALAALTQLSLQFRLLGMENDLISKVTIILNTMTRSHDGTTPDTDNQENHRTEEEAREKEFHEQFPDHFKEFNSFLQRLGEEEYEDTEEEDALKILASDNTGRLSEEQTTLLCSIHRELFGGQACSVDDALRTRVFATGYSAACSLSKVYDLTKKSTLEEERMATHAMALLTTLSPRNTILGVAPENSGSGDSLVDFHNDPNPSQATHAAKPLESLMTRTAQLLTAFPGHPILLSVGTLCEKVRKFDLLTTPVGRVMAGLEVILKQAQDWEQHASERVKIGQPLQEVSQLVARWRRIQLQSWSRLMKTREGRFVKRARRHFIRLNNILHDDVGKSTGDRSRQGDSSGIIRSSSSLIDLVPSWILKGMNANYDIIPIAKDLFRAEELAELIQILDTFILTSPLGEFHERMAMLRSFALQLRNEVTVTDGTSLWRLQQYRALSAIWFYYMQFSEFLSSHLATLRGPIEKKLNDEVKLAKWDEQSYYSLADSTEKNHRKLMKILAEYDDLLDTNAGQLILQESVKGIRAKVDAHDDFCGSVPDQRAMFPLPMDESDDKQQSTESFEENKSTDESHLWTDTSQIQLPSGRINRLPKLAAKMAAISKSLSVEQTSWVKAGTIVSSELCNAVFERIDALRKGSTRPMKERALVDLFRELKRNGLSSMKWSAPNELRQMKSLLQLPLPLDEVEQSGHALGAAERYLMRCINELNALRSETNILGSKHMSRQQTTAMVHFCEHGLLVLVQQRVILADTLVEKKRLEHLSAAVKTGKHIPSNQEKLKSLVHRFQQSFDCVKEGLGQLSLLLKMSQALLNNPSKMEWVRDTITRFEAQLSALGKFLKLENFGLVSEAHIDSIALMANCLQETENVVISSKVQCGSLGCIPVDAFESVLPAIREATMVSMELSSSVNYSDIAVDTKGGDWSDFLATINQSIDSALITAQGFVPPRVESDAQDYEGGAGDSTSKSILECHRESAKEWGSINLRKLNSTFENTILKLVMFLQKSGMDRETNLKAVGLVADVGILGRKISEMTKVRLRDYISQYKSTSKLVYVLLRVFRTLVSKGFCSDTESDDQDGDADGDISGMNFEDDKDGTGMGEGEGKNDVTDQLENEDQLLGLKGDDKNEQDEQPQSSKELDKEQAEQGMEMEGDFEGEMFDLPEQPPDENNDDEDDGEELDREMNDEANPNEEVVDEKMWDEDNEDEQNGKEEEKFEKDSKTQGDAIEGETRTRDPDEEDNNEKDTSKDQEASVEPKPENGDSGDADEVQDDKDEMDINEDTEDRYEERHGVNVRDDDVDDTAEQEDQMDLDDNLELDDNVAEDDHSDAVQDPDAKNDDIEDEEHDEPNEVDKEAIENDVDEGDEETDPFENAAVPTGAGTINSEDQLPEEEDEPEEEENENPIDIPNAQENHLQETHGVKARDGQDAVLQDEDDEMEDIDGENQGERQNDGGTGSSQMEPSQGMGGTGFGENNNTSEEAENPKNKEERANPPNPFKNPGDASKFWHKKLNMIDNEPDPTSQSDDVEQEDNEINHGGDYEYNPSEQDATQVLGEATEEEAVGLEQDKQEETTEDDHEPEELENDNKGQDEKLKPTRSEKSRARKSDKPSTSMQDQKEEIDDSQTDSSGSEDHVMEDEDQIKEDGTVDSNAPGDETSRENLVVTDTTKLGAREQDFQLSEKNIIEEDIANGVSNMSIVEARTKWLSIQHDTHSLSRRLCEKLRLVMEPLVASKLRGDYRTGKRINMKRVIGYIASGYRKDKIWLRRTKPAKRNYRVLLAVDDSESMAKSGAGEMALRAMATLAVGMNQLEIGEVGVASFGDEMRLVHPFHLPFTSESGVNAVQQFDFDQKRTRTALCVESAMAALDTSGDASSMQLVFMISDGRIERDSRTELKRLIREMFERNILLAMIVVEGKSSSDGSRKDSLVNMKEVTFEKGKPVVKRFIEDYPFPYYIILEDMAALPEVLGDALRQWFEMLAQLQKNS